MCNRSSATATTSKQQPHFTADKSKTSVLENGDTLTRLLILEECEQQNTTSSCHSSLTMLVYHQQLPFNFNIFIFSSPIEYFRIKYCAFYGNGYKRMSCMCLCVCLVCTKSVHVKRDYHGMAAKLCQICDSRSASAFHHQPLNHVHSRESCAPID